MADDPYTDESGRKLLSIFGSRGVRANEILMTGAVQLEFLKDRRFRAEDYAAGLSYAVEKGWLVDEGLMIRLTEAGHHVWPG